MADIHKLPWVSSIDVAAETDYVAYLRGLAGLIENGTVTLEGMMIAMVMPGPSITLARMGLTALEAAGALAIAGRIV
jgi:hypothetical protein